MVQKSDGSYRFAVDFLKNNVFSKKNNLSVATFIREILDQFVKPNTSAAYTLKVFIG